MVCDRHDRLWTLSPTGFLKYEQGAWEAIVDPSIFNISASFESSMDPAGGFWTAGSGGVLYVSPSLWQEPDWLQTNDELYSIVETSDHALYAAGRNALYRWNEGQLQTFPYPDNIRLTDSTRSHKDVIHPVNDRSSPLYKIKQPVSIRYAARYIHVLPASLGSFL